MTADDRQPLDPRSLVPKPGWYKMRLVSKGVEVPVRVWETGERDEDGEPMEDITLHVMVNGRENVADKLDWHLEQVALGGVPISEADYNFMLADVEWCREHRPEDPKANPYKPIDPRKVSIT